MGWFNELARLKLGRGNSLRFWTDIWMGTESFAELFPSLFYMCDVKEAVILDMGSWTEFGWTWKWDWTRTYCHQRTKMWLPWMSYCWVLNQLEASMIDGVGYRIQHMVFWLTIAMIDCAFLLQVIVGRWTNCWLKRVKDCGETTHHQKYLFSHGRCCWIS